MAKKFKLTRKLLGTVSVDSGQLMITDPCHIDSEWEKKEFMDLRMHKHSVTGQIYAFKSPFGGTPNFGKEVELFDNYENKTSNGKTMNEMLESKECIDVEIPEKAQMVGTFSYAGICETTQAGKNQINYELGNPGVAVVFPSGYGDGEYEVWGTFNDEGRCIKVEIDCGLTDIQSKVLRI